MAINYTVNIGSVTKKLEHEGFSNVVIKASFFVSAQTDDTEAGNFSYSCGGFKEFSVDEIDPEAFVDFSEITPEVVVEWLLASEEVDSLDEFSYVKASVDNIRARLDELQIQADVTLPNSGSAITGSVTSELPPEPEPEP